MPIQKVFKLIAIVDMKVKDKLTVTYSENILRKKAIVFCTNGFHFIINQAIMLKNSYISFTTDKI